MKWRAVVPGKRMSAGADGAAAPVRKVGTGRLVGGVTLLAVIAGGVAWWLLASSNDAPAGEQTQGSLSEVVVTDMQKVEALSGTLGFEAGDPIGSGLNGTLTGATEAGAIVAEGQVLYWVDEEPVVLLYGDLPAWQAMGLQEVALALRTAGTLTWLPDEGSVLEQGDVIASVDEASAKMAMEIIREFLTK